MPFSRAWKSHGILENHWKFCKSLEIWPCLSQTSRICSELAWPSSFAYVVWSNWPTDFTCRCLYPSICYTPCLVFRLARKVSGHPVSTVSISTVSTFWHTLSVSHIRQTGGRTRIWTQATETRGLSCTLTTSNDIWRTVSRLSDLFSSPPFFSSIRQFILGMSSFTLSSTRSSPARSSTAARREFTVTSVFLHQRDH